MSQAGDRSAASVPSGGGDGGGAGALPGAAEGVHDHPGGAREPARRPPPPLPRGVLPGGAPGAQYWRKESNSPVVDWRNRG
eukprot:8793307-Pyramimonas_sp.AAC.2